ncbi:CRISPR-associated protein, Csd2 family [Halanaerobium saccharolyticum subsp. saccharolyticum DSM 6643]|uniref:CRISPR-associated protein, Csd2 family n=1 Tax=Halanaerobium saccharolyticum subsp. saccharolyticum DSM 6643 TaxID=1293054 RepID=M5DZ03_9FIRM|nr:type I-C CRISPR-associated protein Cas7/Csd2 [Halanaerobium saccharolyticum]CCU78374.1 CRISPR-associated protein, Csd2 family [Halanaerobium saccharolyticum subsp. saccharolyticum DSM 6643]
MIYNNPEKRHDFILIFDVKDGNPNGDPDAGNLPRVDPETMHGLVSDVSLKRKVRNWVALTQDENIYVENEGVLYNQQEMAYQDLELDEKANDRDSIDDARDWMCKNFYDVRTFGAVMSTSKFNCGQVQGPFQLTFARSVDPIVPMDLSITRVAVTKPEDARKQSSDDEGASSNKITEMGRKTMIPYGLYVAHGFYNPYFADNTGVKESDLEIFWESLVKMWDLDRSASRGMMACRGLYVFTHEDKTGNAPANKLFDLIDVSKKDNVETPRKFSDYQVFIENDLPDKITLSKILD